MYQQGDNRLFINQAHVQFMYLYSIRDLYNIQKIKDMQMITFVVVRSPTQQTESIGILKSTFSCNYDLSRSLSFIEGQCSVISSLNDEIPFQMRYFKLNLLSKILCISSEILIKWSSTLSQVFVYQLVHVLQFLLIRYEITCI